MNLNRLSISNLILLILNEENTSILRNEALKELKERAFKYGLNYEDLIKIDESNINKKGFNSEKYLISRKTNMQQLMNTYFTDIYGNDNKLLLSETHLCNSFGDFFDKITLKEISNINKRLKDNNISISDKQRLLKVKDILTERYRKHNFAFFSNDDTYNILKHLNYDFDCNDMIKKGGFSNYELMRRTMLGSFIDKEYIKFLHVSKIIRHDSSKLKEQKKKLLNEVKNGYEVDYHSPEIDKAITKKLIK